MLDRLGVDPSRPSVVFVGRITRQKGVPHLLRAGLDFDPRAQIVLIAGAADTPELAAETDAAVADLHARRDAVFLVSEMLSREDVRQVLANATVFVCPSVYEPLGIVNLEAMASGTAVVASDVGGIPEVVDDGATGLLVHYDPADTEAFEAGLAKAVNELVGDTARAAAMGAAGRERAIARVRLGRRRAADGGDLRVAGPGVKLATVTFRLGQGFGGGPRHFPDQRPHSGGKIANAWVSRRRTARRRRLPTHGSASRDQRQLTALGDEAAGAVPDLAVLLEEAAGDEAGREDATQPARRRAVPGRGRSARPSASTPPAAGR